MNDVNKSMSHRVSMIILGAFLGLLAILACFPFVYMLLLSFTNSTSLRFALSDVHLDFVNYKDVFEKTKFIFPLKNSVIVAFFTCLINALFCSMAAYGLEKKRFAGSKGVFALYMATLGNYPDLFAGKPHASQLKEPMEYEVPEAYKQADPKFAKLIEAGERYIGYPYVWGGDSPETSFDCSGFISWIFKESGVRDVGRLGATSLYGVCTPIEPEEARPGDLIFFQGTLGDGVAGNDGITHVALYVGDGYILNCGNPISYADLTRAYWQEHFYGFGRMYE